MAKAGPEYERVALFVPTGWTYGFAANDKGAGKKPVAAAKVAVANAVGSPPDMSAANAGTAVSSASDVGGTRPADGMAEVALDLHAVLPHTIQSSGKATAYMVPCKDLDIAVHANPAFSSYNSPTLAFAPLPGTSTTPRPTPPTTSYASATGGSFARAFHA